MVNPQSELHVEPGDAPEQAPRFAGAVRGQHRRTNVAHTRRIAEPLRRGLARGLRAHPAIDVITRPLLEVKAELFLQLLFRWFISPQ
jgi:hypothetical protein